MKSMKRERDDKYNNEYYSRLYAGTVRKIKELQERSAQELASLNEVKAECEKEMKRNPKERKLEELVKTMGKYQLEDFVRNLWGNDNDQEHVTVRGANLYHTVCLELDKIDDSNAAAFVGLIQFNILVFELTEMNEKTIARFEKHPNYIKVFSK
jgi:hypothetical protein